MPFPLRRLLTASALAVGACMSRTYVPETQEARFRNPIPAQAWSRDLAHPGERAVVPFGGFGAGAVGLDASGRFSRRHILPGKPEDGAAANCAFYAYQRTGSRPAVSYRLDGDTLGPGRATFHALYPKVWIDYGGIPDFPARVHVAGFTPVLPGNYEESSWPVAVFQWEVWNPTNTEVDFGLCTTWENPYAGAAATADYRRENEFAGYVLAGGAGDARSGKDVEFAVAVKAPSDVQLTGATGFSDADAVGRDFGVDGLLAPVASGKGNRAAFAVRITLAPRARYRIPVAIAWDAPVVEFPADPARHGAPSLSWYRKYTSRFGNSGRHAFEIARAAVEKADVWEGLVDDWQEGVLGSKVYPDWMKTLLFNELACLADAGVLWENGPGPGSPQKDDPAENRFAPITSPETGRVAELDAVFQGSFHLLQLWPDLEKQVARQFASSLAPGARTDRPAPLESVAADLGAIGDTAAPPFSGYNAGKNADAGAVDLTAKFLLLVWRDYNLTAAGNKDVAFLRDCWEAVRMSAERLKGLDRDGDGLPEAGPLAAYNDAPAEAKGLYADGLSAAAARASVEIARVLEEHKTRKTWEEWADKAAAAYAARFEAAAGKNGPVVFADSLAGPRYAALTRLPDLLPRARVQEALRRIYIAGTLGMDLGRSGIAVLSPAGDGRAVPTAGTEAEVLAGMTSSVAAHMIQEGLVKPGERAAWGLYNRLYTGAGDLAFRSPVAWRAGGRDARGLRTGRAGAVWALPLAYDRPHFTDNEGPSAILETKGDALTVNEVEVRWEPASDNVAVDYYLVYRTTGDDEYCVGTVPAVPGRDLAFRDHGLASNTYYQYRIAAVDAASNVGAYSEGIRVKTKPTAEDLAREKEMREKIKGAASSADPAAPKKKKRTWDR